jgi:hypothetical protein
MPQRYLYEPNSAIMKSGGFDEVAILTLNKLQNILIYTLRPLNFVPWEFLRLKLHSLQ